jgi:DNA-binding CsgD family transcriptional regulator
VHPPKRLRSQEPKGPSRFPHTIRGNATTSRRTPVQRLGKTRTKRRVARLRRDLDDNVFAEAAEGARLPLDQAAVSARRMRGRRSRPADGWTSLTPTELQVVATVAEGLSNPQICARLFMSRGTVKTHLSHIYAKLGVTNRAELATAATKRSVP